MFKKSNEMTETVNVNMRGGDGSVSVKEILTKGEYKSNARLVAVVSLKPGCSIGEHFHENEEEIFYILSGEALYCDNGTDVVLSAGDSCVCAGGEKHALRNNSDTEELKVFAAIITY